MLYAATYNEAIAGADINGLSGTGNFQMSGDHVDNLLAPTRRVSPASGALSFALAAVTTVQSSEDATVFIVNPFPRRSAAKAPDSR